jgi:hypothetical protein
VGIMDELLCHEVSVFLCEAGGHQCLTKRVVPGRWRGIWDIRYHRPFLRPCTSINCYGRYRRPSKMLSLRVKNRVTGRRTQNWYILYSALTALRWLRAVILSIREFPRSFTTKFVLESLPSTTNIF